MEATHGQVVTFNYTLSLDDGEILGEPEDRIEYLHGYHNIIPGLEEALAGTQPGERRSVVLDPADAYGEHRPDRLITVPSDTIPRHTELEPGATVVAETGRGPVQLTVVEVGDESVVLDGNHPLAGRRLHFDVEVVDIRAAARHELAQGFPGPQCSTFT
jgi:FKBP-type peptidyl-prolyl cis-trans isomerase SlyD